MSASPSLASPSCSFQNVHGQGEGERRGEARHAVAPPPSGPRGRQLACLDSVLASALASDVFPFIAAPSLGAHRCAEASWVPVTRLVPMVLMLVPEGLCVWPPRQRRSVSRSRLWLRELPGSRRNPGASAQMMLKNRGRKSFCEVSAGVSVRSGTRCFLKTILWFSLVGSILLSTPPGLLLASNPARPWSRGEASAPGGERNLLAAT